MYIYRTGFHAILQNMEICHDCAIQALNVHASTSGSTNQESEVLRKLFNDEELDADKYSLIYGLPITKWKTILNQPEWSDVKKLTILTKKLLFQRNQTMNEYEKQCLQRVFQAVLEVVKERKQQTSIA